MKFLLAVLTLSALSLLPDSASAAASASGSASVAGSAPRTSCEVQPRKSATAAAARLAKLTGGSLAKLGIEVAPELSIGIRDYEYPDFCLSSDSEACRLDFFTATVTTLKNSKLEFVMDRSGNRSVSDIRSVEQVPAYDAEGNIEYCEMVLSSFTLIAVRNRQTRKQIPLGPFTIPRQVLYRY